MFLAKILKADVALLAILKTHAAFCKPASKLLKNFQNELASTLVKRKYTFAIFADNAITAVVKETDRSGGVRRSFNTAAKSSAFQRGNNTRDI